MVATKARKTLTKHTSDTYRFIINITILSHFLLVIITTTMVILPSNHCHKMHITITLLLHPLQQLKLPCHHNTISTRNTTITPPSHHAPSLSYHTVITIIALPSKLPSHHHHSTHHHIATHYHANDHYITSHCYHKAMT